jgi:hypothetical protein
MYKEWSCFVADEWCAKNGHVFLHLQSPETKTHLPETKKKKDDPTCIYRVRSGPEWQTDPVIRSIIARWRPSDPSVTVGAYLDEGGGILHQYRVLVRPALWPGKS